MRARAEARAQHFDDAANVVDRVLASAKLGENQRTRLRRSRIGFVFQSYNLLPSLTVEENLTLPLRLAGTPADRRWLMDLVERVGIADLLHRRPGGGN